MSETGLTRDHVRRARELTLAIFAVWLVVQNVVLLAFVPWAELGAVMVVANALIKAAFMVMAPLWILPLAMLAAWAIRVQRVRDASAPRRGESLKVHHG